MGWQLYLLLFMLMVLLPMLVATCFYLYKPQWLQQILWGLLACTSGCLWLSWSLSQNYIRIYDHYVEFKAGFYQVQLTGLTAADSQIKVLPQTELGDYQPKVNVNAINLPGYRVGWFLLQNNQLAFVMLIGDHSEITVLQTVGNTALVSGNIQQISEIRPSFKEGSLHLSSANQH